MYSGGSIVGEASTIVDISLTTPLIFTGVKGAKLELPDADRQRYTDKFKSPSIDKCRYEIPGTQ